MKTNDIVINEDYIKRFYPCKRGIDNFTSRYPNWQGSLADLLELEGVPYDDKIWLAKRVINNIDLWQVFAIDCAIAAQQYAARATEFGAYTATAHASDSSNAADAANYVEHACDATYFATKAADCASYAAARANGPSYEAEYAAALETEQNRQLTALIYLLDTED